MNKKFQILLAIVIPIVGLTLTFMFSEPVKQEEKEKSFCEEYGTLLMAATEHRVLAQLKSPNSAELAPINERMAGLTCEQDSLITWESYVDANNSFGNQVRTRFSVVGVVEAGQLRIVSIKVGN